MMTLVIVALAWIGYYGLHSLLATDRVKAAVRRRWPEADRAYRLFYNGTALGLLPLPVFLTWQARGDLLWAWPGPWSVVADLLALLGVLGYVATFFVYDFGEFSGLGSAGKAAPEDAPRLVISPLHRFVRHPWYFFALLILWTRDMDPALLTAVIVTTLYLIVGSRLEEERLVRVHGERYRAYRRAVAGLVPLPWKVLSAEEARALAER